MMVEIQKPLIDLALAFCWSYLPNMRCFI